MRYAARKDSTEKPIVAALRAAGASVEVLGLPLDLLVGYRGVWGILEVKASAAAEKAKTPTRARQLAFAERHPNGGPIGTVHDIEGALRFLAVLVSGHSR